MDAQRTQAAAAALAAAHETYFGGYGNDAMELCELFVRAGHQRRGLGSRLLQWGLDKAAADKLHLVLFASLDSEPFYERAGFEAVGCFETHIEGELARVTTVAMVKEHQQ